MVILAKGKEKGADRRVFLMPRCFGGLISICPPQAGTIRLKIEQKQAQDLNGATAVCPYITIAGLLHFKVDPGYTCVSQC